MVIDVTMRLESGNRILKPKVHWIVDGKTRCGVLLQPGVNPESGVEILHALDPKMLEVTCGICCAFLVMETFGEEVKGYVAAKPNWRWPEGE